ncbi:hypothetical protein AKJ16_DCAP27116 [Drosera capensis]
MDRALNMSLDHIIRSRRSIETYSALRHTKKSMFSDNLVNFTELGSFFDLLHPCNDLDSKVPLATLSITDNEFTAPMIFNSARDSSVS